MSKGLRRQVSMIRIREPDYRNTLSMEPVPRVAWVMRSILTGAKILQCRAIKYCRGMERAGATCLFAQDAQAAERKSKLKATLRSDVHSIPPK